MPYPFLSDEWLDAVEKLRETAPEPPAALADLTINVIVQGGPNGDRDVHLTGGQFERGHAESAPTKLTVPYDVAKALFVEGNPQAAMQAFMTGQIKVEGDMSKLMMLQSAGMAAPSPEQQAFQQQLTALTL